MSDTEKPIVIKKIKKGGGHGHHGGAWKIAYADFVTAMMAFFLLMWLINSTSDEQKRGIASYFDPTALTNISGGSEGVMGGDSSQSKDGGLDAVSATNSLQTGHISTKSKAENEQGTEVGGKDINATQSTLTKKKQLVESTKINGEDLLSDKEKKDREEEEKKRFQAIKENLMEALQDNPELKKLMDNLVIDETEEGLRIQMLDQDKRPLFPVGSSDMFDYARALLNRVAVAIAKVPNKISIYGHTDASPFSGTNGYSNWELSSDRANASRRVLINAGVSEQRIDAVVGKESTEPFIKTDPFSPKNRRISIVLVRENLKNKASSKKK